MNKKVSTLLTVALTLGGSLLSSSVFAEDLQGALKPENEGKVYRLVRSAQLKVNSSDSWNSEKENPYYISMDSEQNVIMDNVLPGNEGLWKVVSGGNEGLYKLINLASNKELKIDGVTVFYSADYIDAVTVGTDKYSDAFTLSKIADTANPNAHVKYIWNGNKVEKIGYDLTGESAYHLLFNLEEVKDSEIGGGDLNGLYNEKGFNLDAKKVLEDKTIPVQGNLFNGENPVWAFTTKSSVAVRNASTNGKDVEFPAGTYFFTKRVLKEDPKGAEITADHIDWLNSEYIVLSSTTCKETADGDREKGKGFILETRKGSLLTFDAQLEPNSKYEGKNISVHNACFGIQSNQETSFNFAIGLDEFWFQASEGADKDTKEQVKTSVALDVLSYSGTTQWVVSNPVTLDATNPDKDTAAELAPHKFGFVESSVLDATKLLKDKEAPSVYTIKFISGNSEDKDLVGKYLTVGKSESGFQWEAKGGAVVDDSYPIFQYLITNVSKENDVYSLVTFTNRETGEDFTAKLYPVKGEENRYTLSLPNPSELQTVYPYLINSNTYAVTPIDQDLSQTGIQGVEFDNDIVIELKSVTPDKFAGFLNVEDKSIRTMSFARDNKTTSNKLYAVVNYDEETNKYSLNEEDMFATESTDAAQWQLVKSEKTSDVIRTYVYKNALDGSVDLSAVGDSVSAYSYKLRYIVDGTETTAYLADPSANSSTRNLVSEDKASEFFIKENLDGSVNLFINYNNDSFGDKVAAYDKTASVTVTLGDDKKYDYEFGGISDNRGLIYNSTSKSSDIKLYLDTKRAEISWENAGHVTIASELDNYISMNDERDAISVKNEPTTFYLHKTDEKAVVPSFYISEAIKAGGDAMSERMYMFNPVDSVVYYVTEEGEFNKKYQHREGVTKAIFKAGSMNATNDTLTVKVKGEADKKIAMTADDSDKNVWGGLNRFKFQIVESEDGDGLYNIRQTKAGYKNGEYEADETGANFETLYLYVLNNKVVWGPKELAEKFVIKSVDAPTSNESVAASEVKVVAQDGAVVVKNAAGKNVVVSTILGQVVANEVLTSDNATINVPAGIVVVAVEGESFKVNVK